MGWLYSGRVFRLVVCGSDCRHEPNYVSILEGWYHCPDMDSPNPAQSDRPGPGRRMCWNQGHQGATRWRQWVPRKASSPRWPLATLCVLTSRLSTTVQPGTASALTQRSSDSRNKVRTARVPREPGNAGQSKERHGALPKCHTASHSYLLQQGALAPAREKNYSDRWPLRLFRKGWPQSELGSWQW